MKIEEVTDNDVYEIALWYIERGIVKGSDMDRHLAEQLAADHTGNGINGRH